MAELSTAASAAAQEEELRALALQALVLCCAVVCSGSSEAFQRLSCFICEEGPPAQRPPQVLAAALAGLAGVLQGAGAAAAVRTAMGDRWRRPAGLLKAVMALQAREPEVRQAALAVAAALSSLVEATDPLPAEVPASSAATIARSARAGSTGSLADDSPGVLLFNLYPASDPRPPFAPSPFVPYAPPDAFDELRGLRLCLPGRRGIEPHTEPAAQGAPPLYDTRSRSQLVWPSESCRLYGDGVVTAIPVRLPVLATKYDARRPAGSTAMSRQGSSRSVGGGGTARSASGGGSRNNSSGNLVGAASRSGASSRQGSARWSAGGFNPGSAVNSARSSRASSPRRAA